MQAAESIYQAPESNVETAQHQAPKFFSLSGRIGRLRYLAYSFGLLMLFTLAFTAPFIMLTGESAQDTAISAILGLLTFAVTIGFIVMSFGFIVRRLNDMDYTGWLSLLTFVPLISFFLVLFLMFKSGSKTSNQYGDMQTENSTLVVIAGLFLPAISLVGLIGVVAAVAIPAYQEYVSRAAGM